MHRHMHRQMKRTKLAKDLNHALRIIQSIAGRLPESVATSPIQGQRDVSALLEEATLEHLLAAVTTAYEIAEDLDGL